MKKTIKKKPISNADYKKLKGHHPLTDLSLLTGARLAEIVRLINAYETGMTYIDIKTKMSDGKNRIYLSKEAQECLERLKEYKGKSESTIKRLYEKISNETGITFSSHNLRATFCTNILENGVDIVTASTLMNHSDISQTAQYVEFVESRMSTAVESLSKLETLEGKTLHEMYEENQKLKQQIARLEAR